MGEAVLTTFMTKILVSERQRFEDYLLKHGLANFELLETKKSVYLGIHIKDRLNILRYQMTDLEGRYLHASRQSAGYYDLEDNWDDEANNLFDEE